MALPTGFLMLMVVCLSGAHPSLDSEQCFQVCKAYAKRSSQSLCRKFLCRQAILGYFNRFGKRTSPNDPAVQPLTPFSSLPLYSEPQAALDDVAAHQTWRTLEVAESRAQESSDDFLVPEVVSDVIHLHEQVPSLSRHAMVTAKPLYLAFRERDDQLKSD